MKFWPWSRSTPPVDWIARLEAVERQQKSLVLEWDEWYDKFRRLYARLAKRVSDANKEAEAEAAPELELTPSGAVQSAPRPPGWERDKTYLRRLHAELTSKQRNSA